MAVDYISTLNTKGSGLNSTQIIEALVDAEIVPQQEIIQSKLDKDEVSITAMGVLRSELDDLSTSLSTSGVGVSMSAESSDSAVDIEITDTSAAQAIDVNIEVAQLAKAQVLSFEGFTSALDELPAGTLTIAIGSDGANTQTVTLDSDTDTLTELAEALNALDNVSASVIQIDDDTYALMIKSDLGEDSSFTISADTTDLAALEWSGTSDSTDLSLSGVNGSITRSEAQAAADAILTIDGITIQRSTNTIDDLITGATLTLNSVTTSSARVQIVENADTALEELQTLVDQLNATRALIAAATKRGINGGDSGPLVGDTVVTQIGRWLASITTEPMTGFGDTDYYLSELGVMTNLDGTLEIDEDVFEAAYESNPDIYSAVFESFSGSSATGFTVGTGNDLPTPGAYDFVYTDSETATLNGEALIARTRSDDDTGTEFYSVSDDFYGITIYIEDGSEADATIYFGSSLISQITTYIDEVLDSSGDFTTRETTLEDSYADQTDRMSELDERAAVIETLYRAKFTAMEQLVTSIKSSGEYLTSLIDAWNNQDN